MLVKDICTKDVVTMTTGATVVEAARAMREKHAGDVVVVTSSERGPLRPVGIVTDRDLVLAVLAQAAERTGQLTVGDVMQRRDIVTVCEDEQVSTAVERMWHAAVRRLPVIDKAGGIVGILSVDDVLVSHAEETNAIARLLRAQPGREERDRS
jgi:CBS domain-containing protein